MAEPLALLPIRPDDITLGEPLPQPVYDWHGNVLLAAGSVIQTQSQLDDVAENGFFQDLSWDFSIKKPQDKELYIKGPAPATRPAPADSPAGKEMVIAMEEVPWAVGEAMTLQPMDKPTVRYAIQLVGFIKKKLLFVTAPIVGGKFELIRDGQSFVIRAFSGKKAYAFTASAIKSMHSPHPHLLLTYPREVLCTVVRHSARVQVKIIASITLGQPERVAAGILTDLSMGGASLVAKDPVGSKGEEGHIKFKVNAADADSYLVLKVVLRSITKVESGEGFRHGIEFIDVAPRDRLILSAYVHEILVDIT